MKLGIRAKLLGPFAVLMLLTMVVGGVGISQTSAMNVRAADIYSEKK